MKTWLILINAFYATSEYISITHAEIKKKNQVTWGSKEVKRRDSLLSLYKTSDSIHQLVSCRYVGAVCCYVRWLHLLDHEHYCSYDRNSSLILMKYMFQPKLRKISNNNFTLTCQVPNFPFQKFLQVLFRCCVHKNGTDGKAGKTTNLRLWLLPAEANYKSYLILTLLHGW